MDEAKRHLFSRERLERLYKEIENYIADLTHEEYRVYMEDFTGVKTSIHQRMQQTKN